MIPGGFTPFNPQLHPRAPGGKFAAKGSGSTAPAGVRRATGKRTTTTRRRGSSVPPNGLGYSNAQWSQLRRLAAVAKAGGHLSKHQKHLLAVAHHKRLQALGLAPKTAGPKPKVRTVKPRKATARKAPTVRTRTTTRTTSRGTVRAPKVTKAQVGALRAAGYR